MKKDSFEMVFILDKSGSMAGLEADTIGGFNAMIEKQKKIDGACYVSTFLFSNESQTLHDRLPLSEVAPLTEAAYTPGGCTALLDAIGKAIEHIKTVHRYIRPEDVPEKTMFVITTDGMENASRSFTAHEVKALIQQQREQCGWEFLFLAANIDAVETAKSFGIGENRAMDYHADAAGTEKLYDCVSAFACSLREEGEVDEEQIKGMKASLK